MEAAVTADPGLLAPLKLHYLRWQLFEIEGATYFQYQGTFDTDFDKYTEDAVMLFSQSGIITTFENLEGFPEDWKERPVGFVDHYIDLIQVILMVSSGRRSFDSSRILRPKFRALSHIS